MQAFISFPARRPFFAPSAIEADSPKALSKSTTSSLYLMLAMYSIADLIRPIPFEGSSDRTIFYVKAVGKVKPDAGVF